MPIRRRCVTIAGLGRRFSSVASVSIIGSAISQPASAQAIDRRPRAAHCARPVQVFGQSPTVNPSVSRAALNCLAVMPRSPVGRSSEERTVPCGYHEDPHAARERITQPTPTIGTQTS